MLSYFFENISIPEIFEVKKLINKKKERIVAGDFIDAYAEIEQSKELFDIIILHAKDIGDELLANSSYITRKYLSLFCDLAQYFHSLNIGNYKRSWDVLQNCFDSTIAIGKFVDIDKRYDIPDIVMLLLGYERLYPYNVFASSEMLITKSHCSICNKPMLSLECPHIKGNLYWGEVACEIVDDMKFQAVAMVKHPLDKRCVMELSDDKRTEEERFAILHDFVYTIPNRMSLFEIEEQKSIRKRNDIVIVGRNDPCPCGSGKKFKKCCLNKLYYEHTHLVIHQKEPIKLHMFS